MKRIQGRYHQYHWSPVAKFGFWLFCVSYFLIFLGIFSLNMLYPDAPESTNLAYEQANYIKSTLNLLISFFPILILSPIIGLILGNLVYRSKLRFFGFTFLSGFTTGFIFMYWTVAVFYLSKVIGIDPPSAPSSNLEIFLIYPMLFSVLFIVLNSILAIALYVFSKYRPNHALNSDAASRS